MYHTIFDLKDLIFSDENGEMQLELWRPIEGYDAMYEVSNLGRVKSLERRAGNNHIIPAKILKQRFNISGYLVVSLRRPGSCYVPYVHKLVLEAFVINWKNKPEGNHKKGIKSDNRASQLEWVTKSENILHTFKVLGRKAKGTIKKGGDNPNAKSVICLTDGKIFSSAKEAADFYGLKQGSLTTVCQQRTPSIFGLKFRYLKNYDPNSL